MARELSSKRGGERVRDCEKRSNLFPFLAFIEQRQRILRYEQMSIFRPGAGSGHESQRDI